MGGSTTPAQTLFQVAVALIPALLFGGALLHKEVGNSAATPAAGPRPKLVAGAVIAIVAAAVFAEVIAIDGTIAVNPKNWEIRVVAFVLALGSLIIALRTCAPWIADTIPAGWGSKVAAGIVPLVLAIAVGAQFLLTNSIQEASAMQRLTSAIMDEQTADRQQQTAITIADSAQTRLQEISNDPSFLGQPVSLRRALTAAINRFSDQLDLAANGSTVAEFDRQESEQTALISNMVLHRVNDHALGLHVLNAIHGLEDAEIHRFQALQDVIATHQEAAAACQAAATFHECTPAQAQQHMR